MCLGSCTDQASAVSQFKFMVVSIPSTGTRFCMKLMEVLGFVLGENLSRGHVGTTPAPLVIPDDVRLIIPQRNLVDSYHTICQRYDRTIATNKPTRPRPADPMESMLKGFAHLKAIRESRQYTTWTVPVDAPVDPTWWSDFITFLNIPMETFMDPEVLHHIHAWSRVGHHEHTHPEWDVPEEIHAINKEWGY